MHKEQMQYTEVKVSEPQTGSACARAPRRFTEDFELSDPSPALRLPFDKLRDRLKMATSGRRYEKLIPYQYPGSDAALEGQFGFFDLHNGHRTLSQHAHTATGQQAVGLQMLALTARQFAVTGDQYLTSRFDAGQGAGFDRLSFDRGCPSASSGDQPVEAPALRQAQGPRPGGGQIIAEPSAPGAIDPD